MNDGCFRYAVWSPKAFTGPKSLATATDVLLDAGGARKNDVKSRPSQP